MLEERFASHLRARDANGNYITSDEKLLNYLQDPGTIPSILVLGEVERRQVENKQRQQMEAQADAQRQQAEIARQRAEEESARFAAEKAKLEEEAKKRQEELEAAQREMGERESARLRASRRSGRRSLLSQARLSPELGLGGAGTTLNTTNQTTQMM